MFIIPIYLRSRIGHPGGILKLKISNNLGHKATINSILLVEVNGKDIRTVGEKGSKEPFNVENKDFKFKIITFEGKVRDGNNKIRITALVEDFRKRQVIDKKLFARLNKEY